MNKIKATITKYKMKPFGFGFFGIMIMIVILMLFDYTNSIWIQLILVFIGWIICEHLIEKEVNNWLQNEVKVNLAINKYRKQKKKNE